VVTYTLLGPPGSRARLVRAYYSLDGGGHWLPAVAASGTVTADVGLGTHTYGWDTFPSGFFGQSDDVTFRLVALPSYQNPGPYLYGSYATETFPFRVRGTQVQVLSATLPISNAVVYRLPAGQPTGAEPIADAAGRPFHTNILGYLLAAAGWTSAIGSWRSTRSAPPAPTPSTQRARRHP
jgi:hypothetical protein